MQEGLTIINIVPSCIYQKELLTLHYQIKSSNKLKTYTIMKMVVLTNLHKNSLVIKKLPSFMFRRKNYINYNNALRECEIKKVKHIISKTASTKHIYTKFILDVAGIGEVECNDIKIYPSVQYFTENKGEYLTNIYVYTPLIDIINQIANRKVCFIDTNIYASHIGTYKWNGVEVRYCYMLIPNEIIQTKEEFSFSENCMTFEDCFASKEECEQANAIKVVTFAEDDNHNQVVECIGELGTKCQEIREILNKLSNIVGINAIEGKHTKIDDDIITQGLLSQWRENLEPMENFCVD